MSGKEKAVKCVHLPPSEGCASHMDLHSSSMGDSGYILAYQTFSVILLKGVGELPPSVFSFQDSPKPPNPVGSCVKSFSPCLGYTGN